MPELPSDKSLPSWQQYITEMKQERGFSQDGDKVREAFLLMEELGELCKAIRKTDSQAVVDPNSDEFDVAGELADVAIFLFNLSTMCGVDLDQALRDKEAINAKRTWQKAVA